MALKGYFGWPSGREIKATVRDKSDALLRRAPRMGLPLFDLGFLNSVARSANENEIRSLCNNAYLGNNTAICRILGRYKIFVDTHDVGLSTHLLLDGFWEMWITEVITALVQPGMIVADIGANLGYYTLLMSELVGASGKVHAFEPNPQMVTRLQKSIDVNGFYNRAKIHQVLLGAVDGDRMQFLVPENEPKNGHMVPVSGDVCPDTMILETKRLDANPDWQGIEFAKIDVEGAEELLWEGAEGLLATTTLKTIIIEFTPARYADASAFIDRLIKPGFGLNIISPVFGIQRANKNDVLGGNPYEDVMLLLRR